MKPILLGVCSALFFAVTFVLNRRMELSGGSWAWSSSLRYIFTLPFLLALVAGRGRLRPLLREMADRPLAWLLWGTVGFGLFYAPITFAAAYAPGWLTAGTWQITIISGSLLAPLFITSVQGANGPEHIRGRIPVRGLLLSLIILAGVALLQLEHAQKLPESQVLLGIVPVLIASFAYPLGNRKTMELCGGRLDVFQRILGMTLASMPFWLLVALFGWRDSGLPSGSQMFQSLLVALSSGIVATVLFFRATDLVRHSMTGLAAVEATQSLEVLFALLGEMLILSSPAPSLISWAGIAVIIGGMVLHSLFAHKEPSGAQAAPRGEREELPSVQ
ncbi:multidrug resistance efflux transporter family protein [Paenibacillus sp. HN-1]|uniref:DMT family transporter n=1 Tax=Paenibacillus TaxID=44249 RepID=UPI001CA89CF9|nr:MULTISPECIES: multidrug resistance efflux transporter family protein [Paenibacillus]MBY9081263.1 multidrug resistance efflux transporter family protein [Paenibacillus sp. CGMCC 1.18879]MBY9087536.1 multidrug resistance efflux transporter family protein [Paenibacillus sinensis]